MRTILFSLFVGIRFCITMLIFIMVLIGIFGYNVLAETGTDLYSYNEVEIINDFTRFDNFFSCYDLLEKDQELICDFGENRFLRSNNIHNSKVFKPDRLDKLNHDTYMTDEQKENFKYHYYQLYKNSRFGTSESLISENNKQNYRTITKFCCEKIYKQR